MKIDISKLKPTPFNDELYELTDLSELKDSISKNGQLEPIVVNKSFKIISGHRRYYSMYQLGFKEVEIRIESFENDKVALIEFNKYRQKTTNDLVKEANFLMSYYKSKIGKGRNKGNNHNTQPKTTKEIYKELSNIQGMSVTNIKYLQAINNYQPQLLFDIDSKKESINSAYQKVRRNHIIPLQRGVYGDDAKEQTKKIFQKRLNKLINDFEPQYDDVFEVLKKKFPSQTLIKDSSNKSEYEQKKGEFHQHLDFLKKMDITQYLLYKKYEEVKWFDKDGLDEVESNIWLPSDISNIMETIEEIDNLEIELKFVEDDDSLREFMILSNIHLFKKI